MPPQEVPYDYEEVLGLENKKWSQRKIAAHYGRAVSSYNEWRQRQKPKRGRPRKLSPRQQESNESKLEYHKNLDLLAVRKTKYGELEPTLYISDLDHLDWCQTYLSKERYRYDLPHLRELQDMMWSGDQELGLLPRGDGKTVTYLGMTTRELAEVIRPHVTITTPHRVKILFRNIDSNIVKNPIFRKTYGDIIEVEKGHVQSSKSDLFMWPNEEIPYHDTDPLYSCVSREGGVIGSRPLHVHLEDPTQKESEAAVERFKEYYLYTVQPMLSLDKSQDTRQTGTTTRKNPNDVAAFLFEHGWIPFRYKSVELISGEFPSHNDAVWEMRKSRSGEMVRTLVDIKHRGEYKLLNPHWDLNDLLTICVKDYGVFMSQYQNEPIATLGRYFKSVWWKEREPFDTSDYTKYLVADTAFGMKEQADFNCVGIWIVYYNTLVLIDLILEKNLEFDAICNTINRMARKHNVGRSWVHATLKEIWVVQRLRKLMPGVEPVVEKRSKIERINLLDNPWKLGQIIVFDNLEHKTEAKNQWLSYDQLPSTVSKKDDFPDMCATTYEKLRWNLYGDEAGPRIEAMS